LKVAKKVAGIVGVKETQFDSGVDEALNAIGGLNRLEPIGLVLRAKGDDFTDPLFVLPINDLEKFSVPLPAPIEIKKIADGKFSIKINNIELIGYQKNGYAVVVLETSTSPIPDKPKEYFADIDKHSIGFKLDFANTSHDALVKLTAPFAMIAAMQNPEVGEQFQQSIELCKFYFDEFKTVSGGISIDSNTLDIDFVYNFVPSKTAKIFSKIGEILKNRKTNFNGFKTSKKPILKYNNAASVQGLQLPENFIEAALAQYNAIFDGFLKQVEEDAESPDEIKHAKAAISSVKKLLAASMKITTVDYSAFLDVDGTYLAATIWKETDEVEKLFESGLAFARAKHSDKEELKKFDDLLAKNLKRNYTTVSDYKISSLTIPFSEIAEAHGGKVLPNLKGKSYTIFTAIKDKTAIAVAGGFDATKTETTLKAALASTESSSQITQPLFVFDLQAVGQFLKEIGADEIDKGNRDEETTKKALGILYNTGEKSKITISDKLSGSTYSSIGKVDGGIVDAIAKFVKLSQEISQGQLPASVNEPEDDDEK
jgi:hypothetical protein